MRRIYTYKDGDKYPVEEFLRDIDDKLKRKLEFQLAYISDERNPFTEPYVKHFSTEKYRQMYELRLKSGKTMVRVMFYEHHGEVILLYAFYKKDKRDTGKALETAYRILESIIERNGRISEEHKKEVKLYDKRGTVAWQDQAFG